MDTLKRGNASALFSSPENKEKSSHAIVEDLIDSPLYDADQHHTNFNAELRTKLANNIYSTPIMSEDISSSSLKAKNPLLTSSARAYSNPFLSHYMEEMISKQNSHTHKQSSNKIFSATSSENSIQAPNSLFSRASSTFTSYLNSFVCHAEEDGLGEVISSKVTFVENINKEPPIETKIPLNSSSPMTNLKDLVKKNLRGDSSDKPKSDDSSSDLSSLITLDAPKTEDSGSEATKRFRENSALVHPNGSRLATIQRAYDVFVQMDKDHDHCLKKDDLVEALKIFSPNRSFSAEEVDDIFNTADTTGYGRIHFSEFYAVFACLSLLENKFNNREFNYITPSEVRSAMKEAGLVASRQQLDHMFSMVNNAVSENESASSSSDVISFSDVLSIYMSAPRMENDLFLHSWNKMARSDFLHHKQHTDVSPAQDLLAGTCAGIALTLVGHPFDTVKVRMQTSSQFKSATECVLQTVRKEGPLALYKGMSGPMATIPLINSLVFLAYGLGKSFFESRHPESENGEPVRLSLMEITAAGALSGFTNSFVVSPVELVKTRLQIQYSNKGSQAFSGPMDCITRIIKASGVKGLFRGLASTIYREVPGYGGQFFVYELLKRMFMNWDPSNPREEFELSALELLFSGGVAGMGGWVFSYPMDYIKSQIQAEPWNRPTKFKKNPYLFDGGFFSALRHTIKTKGMKEVWRGFGVCLLRAWPANAAGFLAYESALGYMRQHGLATGRKD